jgi:hypothetical protein
MNFRIPGTILYLFSVVLIVTLGDLSEENTTKAKIETVINNDNNSVVIFNN